jgi:hypothetical protein
MRVTVNEAQRKLTSAGSAPGGGAARPQLYLYHSEQ